MLPEQFIAQLTLSLGPERAGEVFSYIQDSQPSVAVRAGPILSRSPMLSLFLFCPLMLSAVHIRSGDAF